MYYPVLGHIRTAHDLVPSSLINAFDQWLGLLPKFRRKAIIPQDFADDVGLEEYQADELFRLAQDVGLLRPVYTAFCPDCEDLVSTVHSVLDLEDELTCLNGHAFIPADYAYYVRVYYEVLHPPAPPKKKTTFSRRVSLVQAQLTPATGISLVEAQDRDLFLMDDSLFFLSEKSQEQFIRFEASIQSDDSNERGRALESLACSLLSDIASFDPIKDIETYTNQIDVFVEVRPLKKLHNFLSILGPCFVCECKNESSSVSSGDVQKFAQVIKQKSETNLGIIFSRLPLSGTQSNNAKLIQRELVLHEGLYVLNVDRTDLGRINEGHNFLTMLTEKYRELFLDARRPLFFEGQHQLTPEQIRALRQPLTRPSPRSMSKEA